MKNLCFNLTRIASLIIIMLVIYSCEKDDDSIDVKTEKPTLEEKIRAFGLIDGQINISDKTITVGDMIFDKDQLLSTMETLENPKKSSQKQYRTWYTVNKPVIYVYGDRLIPFVNDGLNFAINQYNSLNLDIRFKRVFNRSQANLVIGMKSGIAGLGQAQFPDQFGNPGKVVQIDTDVSNETGTAGRNFVKALVLHEIGHTIGLRHSDWEDRLSCVPFGETSSTEDWNVNNDLNSGNVGYGAYYIWGTPRTDRDSFMRACMDGRTPGFTSGDISALKRIY